MSSEKPKDRGAIYYDGFNLYHAIDDLQKPHLKWLNLWNLAELIGRGHCREIVRAVFCTAYFPGDHGKKVRHEIYVRALSLANVETKLGHTTKEPMHCKRCGHQWDQPREKETDINLALSVFDDASRDVFDIAFVVTADTDQAATFRFLRQRFPSKQIVVVSPPQRNPSKHLISLSDKKIRLTEQHLNQCLFPKLVEGAGDPVLRPVEYNPPGY